MIAVHLSFGLNPNLFWSYDRISLIQQFNLDFKVVVNNFPKQLVVKVIAPEFGDFL